MRDRIEELIWESQDGEISAADQVQLAARLAQDPAARAAAESAASFAARLGEAGRVVPVPAELRPRIHAALAAARRAPRGGRLLASLRSLLAPPPTQRLAYLMAGFIGLLLGVGGSLLIRATDRLGPIPQQELYGTMRPRVAGGVDLVLGGGAGTLTLRRQGDLLDLEIGLVGGREPSADELQIRGDALRIRGLEAQAGGAARLEASPRTIVLSQLGSGRHRLILELADAAAPIEISILAGGRPLLRRQIRPVDL
jgi:hypothetical protein